MKVLIFTFGVFAASVVSAQTNTFVETPESLQVFQQNQSSRCAISFSGVSSYDGMRLKLYEKNQFASNYSFVSSTDASTDINDNWSTQINVNSGLSQYKIEVFGLVGGVEVFIDDFPDLLCGEVIAVLGQSNALAWTEMNELSSNCGVFSNLQYTRAFSKNLGFETENNPNLWSGWGQAGTNAQYSTHFAGGWPLKLQNEIFTRQNLPLGIINQAVPSTRLSEHLPNATNLTNLNMNIYDGVELKMEESGAKNELRTIIWYQGEGDVSDSPVCSKEYIEEFIQLRQNWYADFPNLERIYLVQLNTTCNPTQSNSVNYKSLIREAQLKLSEIFEDVVLIGSFGLEENDYAVDGQFPCHMGASGHCKFGEKVADCVEEFFTGNLSDQSSNHPPQLEAVYYSAVSHSINYHFNQPISVLDSNPNDIYFLEDYFYDENNQQITVSSYSIYNNELKLFLDVNQVKPEQISYLPNSTYNGSADIYFGPLITSLTGTPSAAYYNFQVISSEEFQGGWKYPKDLNTLGIIDVCTFDFVAHDNELRKSIKIGGCPNVHNTTTHCFLFATDQVEITGEFTVNQGSMLTIDTHNIQRLCE